MNLRHRPGVAARALFATAAGLVCLSAAAQTVTLRVHHFLPAGSTAHQKLIKPWCDRIEEESRT